MAPVPERIQCAQCSFQGTVNAYRLNPRVVIVFYHPGSIRVKHSRDVALQIVEVAVQLVFELHRDAVIVYRSA